MSKEMRERLVNAIESYNKRHGVTEHLDVHEVFDSLDSMTDEEAQQVVKERNRIPKNKARTIKARENNNSGGAVKLTVLFLFA